MNIILLHYVFLLPCSTTPPVSVSGSVIDFNVEVTNNGTGSAAPSQLGYYLSDNANIFPCCARSFIRNRSS